MNISKQGKNKDVETINKLIVQAKFYRTAAIGFLVAALFIFIFLYQQFADGNFMKFFERPMFLLLMFLPFIPCAILNLMAGGKEKKVKTLKAALK